MARAYLGDVHRIDINHDSYYLKSNETEFGNRGFIPAPLSTLLGQSQYNIAF